MLGSELTAKAERYIESKYNGFVINLITTNKNGNPDLIACINSKFYGFEIKGAGDTVKPLQAEKIKAIIGAGGKAGVVRKISDIDDIIAGKSVTKVNSRQFTL